MAEPARSPSAQHLTTGAILLCLTTALIWGGQSVATKVAVNHLSPLLTATLRFLIAMPVLLVAAWWRSEIALKSFREFLALAGNAVFFVVQIFLFNLGTQHTTSVRSIILINTFPFFAAIACHVFLVNQKIRRHHPVGMGLAFLGLLVIRSQELRGEQLTAMSGDFIILLAAVSMGCKIAYMKNLLGKFSPLKVVFWANIIGLMILMPACWIANRHQAWEWSTFPVWALLYQGLLVSVVAVFLWNYLLAHYSPNDLTVFRMLAPAVGVVAGAMLLKEPLRWPLVAGGSLVLLGLWWIVRKPAVTRSNNKTEGLTDSISPTIEKEQQGRANHESEQTRNQN